jgi:hypothetical protein
LKYLNVIVYLGNDDFVGKGDYGFLSNKKKERKEEKKRQPEREEGL